MPASLPEYPVSITNQEAERNFVIPKKRCHHKKNNIAIQKKTGKVIYEIRPPGIDTHCHKQL